MNKPSSTMMSKPKWDWTQVDCNLKLQQNRKFTNWSLAPHIVLTSPSGEGPDPTVKLFVDTEKSLQFNEESQWNWHKSWNLPNISVRVEVKDSSTGQALLAPKKLFVQLFAVKAVPEPHEKQEATHLVDVGIRGNSKLEIEDGQAFFTAMKFSSTSYNHEGVKFYLLLVIFIQNNGPTDPPKIITSIVSPPIFVDSRKSARDNHEKKNQSFIEPFLVENLEKEYIKRENKKRSESEIKIKNDFEGLFNYLTAPNIRHKVKHPLFIAIKFSQCSRLFFNTNQTGKQVSLSELINALQRKISKDHYSRNVIRSSSKPEERMFVLQIMVTSDEAKRKKICESIDPVECSSLGIVYGSQDMPGNFENFANLGNMAAVYKEEYSQLYITTRSIFDAEASQCDGENEESESEEEKKERGEDEEEEEGGEDQDKSESEKQSSYPEYNQVNNKPAIEHIPVLERDKTSKEEQPVFPTTILPHPNIQQTIIIPNPEAFYKRSFSEPIVKKPEAQRPIQVPIPEPSQSSKQVVPPQQVVPAGGTGSTPAGGMAGNPLLGYGMSSQVPGYLGEMSLEQLYLNNLMLSNAISNLKPSYSGRMPATAGGNGGASGMSGVPNMPSSIPPVTGLSGIPNIGNMGNMGSMGGMSGLSGMGGMPNMSGMSSVQNPLSQPNFNPYSMMRPDQTARESNPYSLSDMYSLYLQSQQPQQPQQLQQSQPQPTLPTTLPYNPPTQQPSTPTPKVGFSPTIQQPILKPQPNPTSDGTMLQPQPQLSASSNPSISEQQYMMMKQQAFQEVYMQLWQNQRSGMMQGMGGMGGLGGMTGMGGNVGGGMTGGMGGMGMGQMPPMGMNPYMFMPDGMGGYQEPKSENK